MNEEKDQNQPSSQRVGLNNSYYTCFHLMYRVERCLTQEKKGDFLRFLKVAGTIFITTVSKKNFQKKVTTTMVDFNNKVPND